MLNEPGSMVGIVFVHALDAGTQVCDTFLKCRPDPQFMHLSLNNQD